jgi:hypothetical protein
MSHGRNVVPVGLLRRFVLEEDFYEDWQFECREYRDRETIEVEMSVAGIVPGEQALVSRTTDVVLMAFWWWLCGDVWGERGEGGDCEGSKRTFLYRAMEQRRGVDVLLSGCRCCIIRSSSKVKNMWENLAAQESREMATSRVT